MKIFVQTAEDGRILASTEFKEYTDETYVVFDFPENFDFFKQTDFRIVDGKLLHDPLPSSDENAQVPIELERQKQIEIASTMFVRISAKTLSDNDALSVSLLFEEWSPKLYYTKNDIYRYKDNLYRCLSDHDGQEAWTPDTAYSLWVRIRPEGEIPEWEPITPGINEPYSKGDKVTYNGKTWVSDIDNNVWKPGEYGWSVVSEQRSIF